MYAAPPPQAMTMTRAIQETAQNGLVIRQSSQWDEAILEGLGIPYERANKYAIYHLPDGVRAAREHNDASAWHPTNEDLKSLKYFGHAVEESSLCARITLSVTGWLNMRGFTMHFTDPQGLEMMIAQRKCAFGGCCCNPSIMHVHEGQYHLGDVMEDFDPYCEKCSQCCFQCTHFFKILERSQTGLDHNFSLRVNACCCGRTNNCCGASCFREDFIIDVIDKEGKLVSTIQMPYAPSVRGDCTACCRAVNKYKYVVQPITDYYCVIFSHHLFFFYVLCSNYIVEFPPHVTPVQRSLLTAAVFQPEYYFFEREKRRDNN